MALVVNRIGTNLIRGEDFLNTTGLRCVYDNIWQPATFINNSAINCSAPAISITPGLEVKLSVSLNG